MNNIGELFDKISSRYDRFNHITSLGIDRWWRYRAVSKMLPCREVLDVAIGTADLSLEILKRGKASWIEGIDLSQDMMRIGKAKAERKGVGDRIVFTQGSALDMPYEEGRFDALTCAYGLRNFGDTDKGIAEFFRVMKPGGQLLILEFSLPQNPLIRKLYDFYFKHVMTPIGGIMTKDRAAFEYFYGSVKHFIWGDEMKAHLEAAGFTDVEYTVMTMGISTLYIANKPMNKIS